MTVRKLGVGQPGRKLLKSSFSENYENLENRLNCRKNTKITKNQYFVKNRTNKQDPEIDNYGVRMIYYKFIWLYFASVICCWSKKYKF